ncbi:MAG: transglutaminase family protein [Microbacteriaceae bacterium]
MTTSDAPSPTPDRRVSARMSFEVDSLTSFVLSLAVADRSLLIEETRRVRLDGVDVEFTEEHDAHDTRLDLFSTSGGLLEIDYDAVVRGRGVAAPGRALDTVEYLRPSRYCESDSLTGFARERFGVLAGVDLLLAVTEWVHRELSYVSGSSTPTDSAQTTLDRGEGVCRDYAHVVITLLRALDVPARLVSVYAPGLEPMDFHAVVEALVDGRWLVVDATRLAPRRSMVRIATGRDAADTAFLTNTLADIRLQSLTVDAVQDGAPAEDDPDELVELG